MLDRAFALLDSRYLSRLGNLHTLITVGVAGALMLIGLILAAVQLLTKAGWVPLLFLGAGLAVAFAVAISRLRIRLTAPQAGIASEPLPLSERLVAFYREGERLRSRISRSVLDVPGDLMRGTAAQRQVAREQLARDWDGRVLDALADDRPTWTEAGTLPTSKLDYVTTIAGVRAFLTKKLACLKEIIGQLEDDQ